MNKKIYETPNLEVLSVELEEGIMRASLLKEAQEEKFIGDPYGNGGTFNHEVNGGFMENITDESQIWGNN